MAVPRASAKATDDDPHRGIAQVRSRPAGTPSGAAPTIMPMKPSIEPTDRSMLRETMTSTMPVAMIAMDEVWTVRNHRFRGVRNLPPDRMWKPSQMTRSATTRPSSRASSSVARQEAANGVPRIQWTARVLVPGADAVSHLGRLSGRSAGIEKRPAPRGPRSRAHECESTRLRGRRGRSPG